MPFEGIGTASHAHLSLNTTKLTADELSKKEMSFFASVLDKLPAICAFALPQPVSYKRIADDSWMGGTWITWGTQNRETPLRRSGEHRWEIRCMDGLGNMYLNLAAFFAAGLHGTENGTEMRWKDCERESASFPLIRSQLNHDTDVQSDNPSRMSDELRSEYGILNKMPTTIDQSLAALESDVMLPDILGKEIVEIYLNVKKAEQEKLNAMPEGERRTWLIERY